MKSTRFIGCSYFSLTTHKMKYSISILFVCLFFWSCSERQGSTDAEVTSERVDPLPSWNDGVTKTAIMSFVSDATNEQSPNFIPLADRITTFDNDGNLWAEQPMYFQLFFVIDRVKALASEHPEWATEQPFKAVLEDDMEALMASGERGLLQLVMVSHAGVTTDEFETIVSDWLATARHPKYDKPFNQLIYQPMLELLQYLRANDFKTFIVSGGGVEFMRVWVEEAYGIPKDQVVGSSIKTEFDYNDGSPVIRRLPEIDFIDDKAGKPVGISKFIGRRPVLASGNSDGDLEMIQYVTGGDGPRLGLYLHHTDAEREYAYDRESHIGKLDKGLDEAAANSWTVIDMAKDWKVVFPFELAQ